MRSKLIYGQEVYFSAPNTLLNKLQSIDSKAIKLAISVLVHTNTSKSYAEIGMISLSEQRKLAISKYVIGSLAVINSVTEEIFIDSNKDYPKSAQNISSIQPIRNYINDLINECNIDIKSNPVLPTSLQMPQWEHINARFDTDYTDLKKNESTNILAIQVREHLNNQYQNHLKIFTDGSVLDSLDSGAGFVIPDLKVQKSFYLGKVFSIFTFELYAVLMALNYICNFQLAIYNFVICVDSKSVLCAQRAGRGQGGQGRGEEGGTGAGKREGDRGGETGGGQGRGDGRGTEAGSVEGDRGGEREGDRGGKMAGRQRWGGGQGRGECRGDWGGERGQMNYPFP